jgi:signal transduction histidine kinase
MRPLFRRSIIWLVPAVLIPLAALLVMQVRFLRSLEQKTASAERNWQRTSLELVTSEIENRYRTSAKAALGLTAAQSADPEAISRHFAAQSVPGARTFFATRFDAHRVVFHTFDGRGSEKHVEGREMEAIKLASVSWHVAHKLHRVAPPALHVDERDPQHRVISQPIVDESLRVIGVAGVVIDDGLARAAMTTIGNQILKDRNPKHGMALRVAPRFPRPIAGDRDYITQSLGFVFTDWRAGVRDLCETPEEMAAVNFRNNMMWTGGAFVVLLGAVGLALGAVARQMRLSQMKSDFVSNVSHELRTPLSSIRVFGEYMRLGRVQKPEKIREYGEYIEAESRRLTQLINNILDFSKIEAAEKKYRFAETDVVDVVEHTVAAFEVPLRDHGVAISLAAPAGVTMLHLDADALAQVLMNLLDNAVKYSNGRKEIDVVVTTGEHDVRIAIRDHGIGIAPAEQKKIFEKFYRVGSTLVHDVKGSGLGLSIVRHVVEAHGGRIEVESAPGAGSTFTIVLPLRREKHAAAESGIRANALRAEGDHA